jgi:hypothetical protein
MRRNRIIVSTTYKNSNGEWHVLELHSTYRGTRSGFVKLRKSIAFARQHPLGIRSRHCEQVFQSEFGHA